MILNFKYGCNKFKKENSLKLNGWKKDIDEKLLLITERGYDVKRVNEGERN